MKQYKGELLASCLQLLLSLPIELVTEEIGSLVPAVQVSSQGLYGRDPSPLSTHFGHLGHPQSYGVPLTQVTPSHMVSLTHRSPPVIWCPSHTQVTLKLGLSYLPLANAGLDALEAWTSQLPPGLLQPYLQQILPNMDAYLRTQGTTSESVVLQSLVSCDLLYN